MNLNIVWGAPCSGKTTYVRKKIGDNDLVYDYDALSNALKYGKERVSNKGNVHRYVIDFRFRIIHLAKEEKELDNIWIISTFLTDEFRKYVKDLNPNYIKLDETKETCLERLANDDARPDKEEWKAKIEEWFERFGEEEEEKRQMSKATENIEKLMKEKKMEFRDFRIGSIETRSENGNNAMVIEGLPCVFNSETVLYNNNTCELREKINPNAFTNCDMTDVIFNFNHGGRVYARTRNKSLSVEVKEDGLHMKAVLMSDDEGHAQLYRDIKSGLIDKMSFAFTVKKDKIETFQDEKRKFVTLTREVLEIDKLYDVSAVDIPAYDATAISARSVFSAEREKRNAESIEKQKLEELKQKTLLKLKLGEFGNE